MRPALVLLSLAFVATAGRAADVPVVEEVVVPGELTVRIHSHSLTTQGGPLPAWTFVSNGLWARHQKELRITVKREPAETAGDYPRDLLGLYRIVYELAGQGRLVDVGGMTQLSGSAPPLLGRDEFRCLLYASPQAFEGVPVEAPSLTALIVTCDEADAARRFGVTRLAARLGLAERFFPTTPWADRRRRELVGEHGNDGSMLARVRRALVPAARVRKERDDRIVLTLLPTARDSLRSLLDQEPNGGFALLVAMDPRADACLVWQPGQTGTQAIAAPGSSGERIAANFLILTTGASAEVGGIIEDGVGLSFGAASWERVRDALVGGKPLSLPSPMGGFEIAWVPVDYVDPASGRTYRAPEGWETYAPQTPRPPDGGPVAVDKVVLLTAQEDVAARIGVEALAAFTGRIEAAVAAEVAATPLQGKVGLLVDYSGDEQRRQTFKLAFRTEPPRPFADRLQRRLDELSPPPVKGGPIHFQLFFRIDAAAAPAAPPAPPAPSAPPPRG